ncbi:hypothetical protein [Cryptosporangium sp. NPDC051539]|uniref:hypothetical protein n=1 Tax=Cryptosporangium sp. NPDC051539 TaxID=3363962 RepID=UPI0037AE0A2A
MSNTARGDEDVPGQDPQDQAAAPRLINADRFEWERLLRRIILPVERDPKRRKSAPSPQNVMLVGLVGATYADPDGTRVRPGTKLLAKVTGLSEDVVGRCLRRLVAYGLYNQLESGSSYGRGQRASDYRLSYPEDLLERFELLPASELPDDETPPAPCGQPAVRVELTAPAPCEQPDHTAPAPPVPAAVALDHTALAPPDDPITRRQRLDQVALAPTHQPIDQPPLRPTHSRPSTAVTPPTRDGVDLWTAKVDPALGLGVHPWRGVARVPGRLVPSDPADHPGSTDAAAAVDAPADATPTVPLPQMPDPGPGRRTAAGGRGHLRLVHSTPDRRPA